MALVTIHVKQSQHSSAAYDKWRAKAFNQTPAVLLSYVPQSWRLGGVRSDRKDFVAYDPEMVPNQLFKALQVAVTLHGGSRHIKPLKYHTRFRKIYVPDATTGRLVAGMLARAMAEKAGVEVITEVD